MRSAFRVPHSALVPALSSLVSWYNTNREALAARRAGLARARRELGDTLQEIHIGPRDGLVSLCLPW